MKPKTEQPKSYTQRFLELQEEMFTNALTKEEAKEAIDQVIAFVKKMRELHEQQIAENKTEMSMETARLGKQVAEFEARLRDLMDSSRREVATEIDTKANELSSVIGYVESLIEYYDDKELRTELGTLKTSLDALSASIPKEFDASGIVDQLAEHEREIEELKKRPVGGGTVGGVSNLRIQQAFKYILKTEEPVGDIDGANLTYTLSQPIFAILSMSINGETIAQLPNYTISGNTFTFSSALPAAYSGKDFEVKYV